MYLGCRGPLHPFHWVLQPDSQIGWAGAECGSSLMRHGVKMHGKPKQEKRAPVWFHLSPSCICSLRSRAARLRFSFRTWNLTDDCIPCMILRLEGNVKQLGKSASKPDSVSRGLVCEIQKRLCHEPVPRHYSLRAALRTILCPADL